MVPQPDPDEGLLFDVPRAKAEAAKKAPEKRRPAAERPVARVVVDTPLPHLDRPFDYRVPASMADSAVPGCRVRVPFNGQLLSGFLLERVAESEFEGRLAYLHQVVSPEPVLTPEIRDLARAVADRYAGTLSDVLRLAIPPRHARVEKERPKEIGGEQTDAAQESRTETTGPEEEPESGGQPSALSPGAGATDTTAATPATEEPNHPTEAVPDDAPEEPGHRTRSAAGGTAAETGRSTASEVANSGADDSRTDAGAAAALAAGTTSAPEGHPTETATNAGTGEPTAHTPPTDAPQPSDITSVPDTRTDASQSTGTSPDAGAVESAEDTTATTNRPHPAEVVADAAPEEPGHRTRSSMGGVTADADRPTEGAPDTATTRTGHPAAESTVGGASAGPAPSAATATELATVESTTVSGAADPTGVGSGEPPDPGPWVDYPAGPSFLKALRAGRAPRAVWNALPGPGWADAIAVAVRATLATGHGAVAVVPDGRDVAAVDAALTRWLGEGRHVALTAELGPAERYRRWLSVLRGTVRAVVGTRAAMFAPVRDLGLVVLWDDGDDVHSDPHAPYPHARTVLSMRAHRAGAAALIGGFTRTAEGAQLVESGWAHPVTADRATLRHHAPRVHASGDDSELARDEAARSARLPSLALRVAREAARSGPVLIQVPRRGYLAALACDRCRAPARCASCQGPLAMRSAHAMPYCRWCGRIAGEWECGACGGSRLRANVVGARRTAEELGRAFPSLTVRTSGREEVLTEVPDRPALVVATPGAEPAAPSGYAAALLLDGWALLGRADLRAGEEALRRWCNAAALVRPASDGGQVVVLADSGLAVTQALIRWDPAGYAERELVERRELGFPPAVTMASVTGEAGPVRELLDQLDLPDSAELLGPVPAPATASPGAPDPAAGAGDSPTERALLRVPRSATRDLTRALKAAAAARSARKQEHQAQLRVDPLHVV